MTDKFNCKLELYTCEPKRAKEILALFPDDPELREIWVMISKRYAEFRSSMINYFKNGWKLWDIPFTVHSNFLVWDDSIAIASEPEVPTFSEIIRRQAGCDRYYGFDEMGLMPVKSQTDIIAAIRGGAKGWQSLSVPNDYDVTLISGFRELPKSA